MVLTLKPVEIPLHQPGDQVVVRLVGELARSALSLSSGDFIHEIDVVDVTSERHIIVVPAHAISATEGGDVR